MVELILNENVQTRRQLDMEVIRQMCGIVSPGQRDDLYTIPLCAQILDQFTII